MSKVVEAVYEKGTLRLLEKLKLLEGVKVKIKIEGIYGLLKDWKVDPQKLKDELRSVHG